MKHVADDIMKQITSIYIKVYNTSKHCENSPFVQFVNTLQMLSSCILHILQFESLQLILNTAQMACMSFDSQLVLLKFRLRTGQYVDFWSDVFIVMTNMKANSMVGI